MDRFLIEVPHDGTAAACARAAELLMRTGSHFLTRADFGCADGAQADHHRRTAEDARNVVPPDKACREHVRLNYFTLAQIDELGATIR
jgi:hypothetical protein